MNVSARIVEERTDDLFDISLADSVGSVTYGLDLTKHSSPEKHLESRYDLLLSFGACSGEKCLPGYVRLR